MNLFIYFYDRLPCGLDEIEDELADALREFGEVTGAGTGVSGSNIDVEIDNKIAEAEALKIVREALADLNLPSSTVIKINGKEHSL